MSAVLHQLNRNFRHVLTPLALPAAVALCASTMALAAPPLPGAIFTTDSTCTGVNLNIYGSKDAVCLDGGPAHPGAAGLPDGCYCVQITEPDGTVLGTSVGSGNATPVCVANGEFAACYQLSALLIKASDGTAGYDDTTNPGGEYKVWVSNELSFVNNSTKTDNFKVKPGDKPPTPGTICVAKFYDANANGINDDGQPLIWKVNLLDSISLDRFTPQCLILDPDTYTVSEYGPVEGNWLPTTAASVVCPLVEGATMKVEFGNLCLGAGGGLTLGFWSNKNGQSLVGADDLAMLVALNLRNPDGSHFNPATYALFRPWLLNANAVNMACILSAQLAAMELNVFNAKVNGSRLIYAPGATSANALGFATVNALMAEANASLGANGYTVAAGAVRSYQEALKNALDQANNNLNFVQPTPCSFSFAN
jgi:hypothetical protein